MQKKKITKQKKYCEETTRRLKTNGRTPPGTLEIKRIQKEKDLDNIRKKTKTGLWICTFSFFTEQTDFNRVRFSLFSLFFTVCGGWEVENAHAGTEKQQLQTQYYEFLLRKACQRLVPGAAT